MKISKFSVLILSAANSIHTVRWVNSLSERGLNVHLVFLPNHSPTSQHKISKKVTLHKLRFSGSLGYYVNFMQLRKIYSELRPNLVNAHFASGYGTLARTARLRPLLLSVWGSDVYAFPYKNNRNMRIVTRNLNYADALASTSESMAHQVTTLIGERHIYITPFGVSIESFKSRAQSEIANTGSTIRIGNIKTLKPLYAIDVLIKASRHLIDNLSNHGYSDIADRIRVDIYGEGPQQKELEELIKHLKLEGRVNLKGLISNTQVPSLLKTFDIFCVTSSNESFGVSVVEAMAAGVPVVATDVDGFREVTDNARVGVLVEKNSPLAVAVALELMIKDKNLRQLSSVEGKAIVERKYSWHRNVDHMIEVYSAVSGQRI